LKKRELTSKQIIEAAIHLIAKVGLEKTSLGMIAAEVGITKPSIYYHFSSKEELVSQIFDHMFHNHYFESYFSIEQINHDSFIDILLQGGLRMLPNEMEEHLTVTRVLHEFTMLAERDEHYRDKLLHMQNNFVNGFRELLTKGVELGLVEPRQLDAKAHILALVIDNLSRCVLMKYKLDVRSIWKEAINNTLLPEAKIYE